MFTSTAIEAALRQVAENNGVAATKLIHPVRLAVTGVGVGPGLFDLLALLGKETVLRRLQNGATRIPLLL